MGWSKGTTVLDRITVSIVKHVQCDIAKENLALDVINALVEEADADTLCECYGCFPWLDRALDRSGVMEDDDE